MIWGEGVAQSHRGMPFFGGSGVPGRCRVSCASRACSTVRGKPSKMKPFAQSGMAMRSLMIFTTISSDTSPPLSITCCGQSRGKTTVNGGRDESNSLSFAPHQILSYLHNCLRISNEFEKMSNSDEISSTLIQATTKFMKFP